jgi:hypothetical protein
VSARARVAITMAVGAALIGGLLLGVLLHAPYRVLASNRVAAEENLASFQRGGTFCQSREFLPAGTDALRVSTAAYVGPAISLSLSRGNTVLARGHRGAGWVASTLTFALRPRLRAPAQATLCLRRDNHALAAGLIGGGAFAAPEATLNGTPLRGRLRVEYLTAGQQSWLSLARHVVRRLGLGHAPSGGWIVIPLVLLMALATTLAAWLMLRTQDEEG